MRSVTQRIRNKYEVAVADLGDSDTWQLATMGVACVSNSARLCDELLHEIIAYVESSRLDAEVMDVEIEVITL